MKVSQKYDKSLTERWSLRFKTGHPDGNNYHGVITHIKPGFVVLREERDFEFDGIVVLPKRSIKSVRDSKYELCCNEILRTNGAMKKLRPVRWLDRCETILELLIALMRRDIWPGVEIIFGQGAENAFYVGPITRVADDHFFLNCYDAMGQWEKEYKLNLDEVLRVEFDSKYCNHFNAYMRSKGRT